MSIGLLLRLNPQRAEKEAPGTQKWMKCKAAETEGEGSVHKYMTEPELVEGNAAIRHL